MICNIFVSGFIPGATKCTCLKTKSGKDFGWRHSNFLPATVVHSGTQAIVHSPCFSHSSSYRSET